MLIRRKNNQPSDLAAITLFTFIFGAISLLPAQIPHMRGIIPLFDIIIIFYCCFCISKEFSYFAAIIISLWFALLAGYATLTAPFTNLIAIALVRKFWRRSPSYDVMHIWRLFCCFAIAAIVLRYLMISILTRSFGDFWHSTALLIATCLAYPIIHHLLHKFRNQNE